MKLLKTMLLLISWTSCWSKNVQIIICPSLTSFNNSNCQCIDAINKTYDAVTNPTLQFMPGIHVLSADVIIENTNTVTIIGSSEMVTNMSRALYGYQMATNTMIAFNMSTSIIHCGNQYGLSFRNVANLLLINVTFINCGGVFNGSAVNAINVNNILLQGVTIVNSSNMALFGSNISGNLTVISTTFVGSQIGLRLSKTTIAIINSKFGNLNYALQVTGSIVQCSSCLFEHNRFGIMADSLVDQPSNSSVISLVHSNFTNCIRGVQLNNSIGSVISCKYTENFVAAAIFSSTTDIFSTTFTDGYTPLVLSNAAVKLSNVSIIRNQNSGVIARFSRLTLTNSVSFNHSYLINSYGGALNLIRSVVYLLAPAKVVFFNNTAMIGGAMYAGQYEELGLSGQNTVDKCIVQVYDSYGNITAPGVQLVFIDNLAPWGGSDLYANIKTCALEESPGLNYNMTDPGKLFNAVSTRMQSQSNSSNVQVQYVPDHVYFCQTEYTAGDNHMDTNQTISMYPGESIRVWLACADVYNNHVPAALFVQTNDARIPIDYFTIQQSCQPYSLPDSIVANNYNKIVYFGLDTYGFGILGWEPLEPIPREKPRAFIAIKKILTCPSGFTYAKNVCNCSQTLLENGIICNITEKSFSMTAGTAIMWWLGTRGENDTDLVFSTKCPQEYCNSSLRKVFPTQSIRSHCNFNRSGVLCGKCLDGLSETFGEHRCAMCESNKYIAYLAMFAALGLALVLLIFALDLTVSGGTINELIFYANVLNINSTVTFPSAITSKPFIKFLYVFIAWLNLDLGLELCFYNGMDNYQKAWLQFGFSLYLLVIVGIIVIASRRFKLIAALCGRNVIPVIATIVRLSYTKVLRNVFSIFEFAYLYDADTGTRYTVWLYDGNVMYLGTPHLILCIFGCFITVVFIIPYTSFVLFSPCLQNRSHWKALCWVQKLVPYIDSYHAPFKDKYRFWTGFLLAIRILLSVLFVSFPDVSGTAMVYMVVVVLIFVFILFLGLRVYKKNYLLILGSFFYMNLIFICLTTLFIEGSQNVVDPNVVRFVAMTIAVGSAFCCFVGIVIFHCIKKLAKQLGVPLPQIKELELASIHDKAPLAAQSSTSLCDSERSCDLRETLLV